MAIFPPDEPYLVTRYGEPYYVIPDPNREAEYGDLEGFPIWFGLSLGITF